MSESFNAYREQYLRRHENPVNNALHTVADVVDAGGLAAAIITRRARVGVIGYAVAFAIGTVAHLFNPGPCETTSSRASAIRSGPSEPKATDSLVAAPNRPRRWCHQVTPWHAPRGSGEVSQYRADME